MNPEKVASLKMLFFDCISSRRRRWFNETQVKFLQRNNHYRLFKQGLHDYNEEINIVNLLRDLRYYKAAVDQLMKNLPKQK